MLTLGGPQLLSYDTTFQLGDCYVSPFIFRHTIFEEKPCIPAMFLIHERKFTETHREMFKECVTRIPALKRAKCPMVIDKERAFVNAAKAEISNVPLVHCWNHIFQAMRLWLRKHGAPSQDIAIYSEDVFKLFHSVSEEQYEQQLAIVSQKWDAAFEQYYRNEIHPDVPSSIGRWVLEELHIYNPYSGVTNNQSEGLNRVIKDLQGWKEAPVDCVMLAVYQLQAFYLNEIRRGLAGIGEYHLKLDYASIQANHGLVHYIPTSTPEEVVEKIKNGESTRIEEVQIKKEAPDDPPSRTPSVQARAQQVLASNQISFDPKLHVFNVKGTSGVTRVVTIFPKESCSCPSTSSCYHILAVKLSLGAHSEKPSTRNLTRLRSNTRSKKDKKSGRKRPRAKDLDPEDQGMHPHVTDCYHSHFYSHDCTFLQEQQLMLQVICPTVHLKEKVKVWIK